VDHSVTIWLRQLAKGDQAAAQKLWERYGPTLIQLARRRFRGTFNAVGDEDDLVQSVFNALWQGAQEGRYDEVRNREELWWLLLTITRRTALNRQAYNQRKKRGPGTRSLDGDTDASNFGLPADSDQSPPEMILMLEEQQQRLLGLLRDDVLRSIALWKLEGYSHDEIATKLSVTPRTIVRKVNLIRERWAEELKA
jgi:RNA polymerase sigma factor (sigma-70 family)